jgi:hypothetical protein
MESSREQADLSVRQLTPFNSRCSLLLRLGVLGEPRLAGMDGADKALSQQEHLSHEEIIARFKKVFGRDMTAAERKSFFLDLPLSKEHAEL